MGFTGRELRSQIDEDGTLTLSLQQVEIGDPGDDEIIVRVEATPINPSDLGLLLGPADISTLKAGGTERPSLRFTVPQARLAGVKGRLGRSMTIGNKRQHPPDRGVRRVFCILVAGTGFGRCRTRFTLTRDHMIKNDKRRLLSDNSASAS